MRAEEKKFYLDLVWCALYEMELKINGLWDDVHKCNIVWGSLSYTSLSYRGATVLWWQVGYALLHSGMQEKCNWNLWWKAWWKARNVVILGLCTLYWPDILFSKVENETQVSRLTQSAQDQYEVNVRAANIVSFLFFQNLHCFDNMHSKNDGQIHAKIKELTW